MNVTDRRQTDRPRYGEMCRNRRNRLRCNSDSDEKAIVQRRRWCAYQDHMEMSVGSEFTATSRQQPVNQSANHRTVGKHCPYRPTDISQPDQQRVNQWINQLTIELSVSIVPTDQQTSARPAESEPVNQSANHGTVCKLCPYRPTDINQPDQQWVSQLTNEAVVKPITSK